MGLFLWFNVGVDWVVPVANLSVFHGILLLHVVLAVAIITQRAAVAIAYDMWEDRELAKESEPGEASPAPMP